MVLFSELLMFLANHLVSWQSFCIFDMVTQSLCSFVFD